MKSQFDIRYKVGATHYFQVIANYAKLEDNVFENLQLFEDTKSGQAVGYSCASFLGPIELKFSWTPDKKKGY